MDLRSIILAQKYAQAFLNLFMDSLTPQIIANLETIEKYLHSHKNALFYFGLHHISTESKLQLLDELEAHFKPTEPVKKLFETLIKHNRAQLIILVIRSICQLYRKRKNILLFDIQSSHELDAQSITLIEKFLARTTGKQIISRHHINKNLIAGIRLQSDTFLWEYSIGKQIKKLSQTLATKEYQ